MDVKNLLIKNNILNVEERQYLQKYILRWSIIFSRYNINLHDNNLFLPNKDIICSCNKDDIIKYIDQCLFLCCIDNSNYTLFKYLKEQELDIDIVINHDVNIKEKYQNQLDKWLEEKYNEKNEKDIKFLLNCGAEKEEALKISIGKPQFESFKILIKEEESLLKEIKNNEWNKGNKLQKQLDIWLEEKYNEKNEKDIKFLLNCGAEKEEALKISIEKPRFESFKILIKEKESLFKEIKNNEWNKGNKLQKQLDSLLEIKFKENNIKDIKFLLNCGAEQLIIYKKIKELIEQSNYDKFIVFTQKLKKSEIITYEGIKNLVAQEIKLQNQINSWLEIKCKENNIEDIKFLLNCGAARKTICNKIKVLIKTSSFYKFKSFVKKLKKTEIITYKGIKNLVVQEVKLQENLNNWLKEKCDKKDIENIKFLLDCGADNECALKASINQNHFESFKYLVEKGKKILDKLRNNKEWNEKVQNKLDVWFEEKYLRKENKKIEDNQLKDDIAFLLDCGISKKAKEEAKNKAYDIYKKKYILREPSLTYCSSRNSSMDFNPMDKDMSSRK